MATTESVNALVERANKELGGLNKSRNLSLPTLSKLDSSSLKDSPKMNLESPAPATESAGALASFEGMTEDFNKNLKDRATTLQGSESQSFEDYFKALASAEGETTLTDKAYKQTVDPLEAELLDINDQMRQEQMSLRRRLERLDENPQGMFGGALEAEKSRIERESLKKQADLAVIQMARQGKYDSAKAIADRAVSAALEGQKNRITALQVNYERYKDLFTTAEQRAFESAQADRNRELDMEAQKEMMRYQKLLSDNGGDSAPTIKTINGVDMQWNSSTGQWETITAQGPNEMAEKTVNQLDFVLGAADNAEKLAFKSGSGAIDRTISGALGNIKIPFGLGKPFGVEGVGGEYQQLEAYTNSLKTNMLTLATDPSIKKFFGPQMSNADVLLMTSAGTTLNPEKQSPAQLREEITRIKDFVSRAREAVAKGQAYEAAVGSGMANIITAPDGSQVMIVDD